MLGVDIAIVVVVLGGLIGRPRFRVVRQFERGVVFRWGRVLGRPREAGIAVLRPFSDKLVRVNTQIITAPVPAQEGITRDNVTVRVDAVLYYRVIEPVKALVEVQDFSFAMIQVAQTSLRSIIGKSELDDLLSNREQLNQGLALLLESPAVGWGIHIDRVEIKDVALPESMKRTMARQAEADRERRARIITADGELQASKKLAQAADVMSDSPAALQLRLLQTMVEVASEKSSTVILPFPVELLRFLEHNSPPHPEKAAEAQAARERVAARAALSAEQDAQQLAAAEDALPAIEPMPEIPDVTVDPPTPTANAATDTNAETAADAVARAYAAGRADAEAAHAQPADVTEQQLEAELGPKGK
jgi:regulator of protease activity HflC (stomatin/prohibitin superfamily)